MSEGFRERMGILKSKQLNDKDITPPNEPLISNKVR